MKIVTYVPGCAGPVATGMLEIRAPWLTAILVSVGTLAGFGLGYLFGAS